MKEEPVKRQHQPLDAHIHQPVSVFAEGIRKTQRNENPARGASSGWIIPENIFSIVQAECFPIAEILIGILLPQRPGIPIRGFIGWLKEKLENDIRVLQGGVLRAKGFEIIWNLNLSGRFYPEEQIRYSKIISDLHSTQERNAV